MNNRILNIIKNHGLAELVREGVEYIGWRIKQSMTYAKAFNTYLQLSRRNTKIDPLTRVWVDPDTIEFVAGQLAKSKTKASYHFYQPSFPSHGKEGLGTVVGGSWDQEPARFEELEEYKMLEQRIVEGRSWDETEFFQRHVNDIDVPEGVDTWSESKLSRKLSRLDGLIENIRTNGVVPHEYYNGHFLDEIIVYMGRNGEFYWNENGRHRLAIAKIIDIDMVPVLITLRHEKAVYGDYIDTTAP